MQSKDLDTVRRLTLFFIAGLLVSGATAIPLAPELNVLVDWLGSDNPSALAAWIVRVRDAVLEVNTSYPFLAYGTDWLAFGHFVIAVAFVGAWKDPVKNEWLFTFGMIACALVVPYALLFGDIRGIPIFWRLIDCSFGAVGIVPLWYCRRLVRQM